MSRWICCIAALLLTAALVLALLSLPGTIGAPSLPGSNLPQRTLLRIWVTGSPGGGMRWLQHCLASFEKAHPGLMTYVRQVSAEDCAQAETLPDVILHMPGDLAAPETLLLPLTGDLPCDETLLRCGRWKAEQYGLPLCWSGWVLAVDSQWDVIAAATPAPTTLLGRPAVTADTLPTASPGYPADKIADAETSLLAPEGGGLFALCQLLPEANRPPLDASFLLKSPADVYQAFLSQKTASALLTTGQMTAFESLQRAGKGFPARMLVPEAVVTDQVWLAGLCTDTEAARQLLAHLIGEASQQALTEQGLYGILNVRALYPDGNAALVEASARRALTAINAYVSAADVAQAAWQAFFGAEGFSDALLPLL